MTAAPVRRRATVWVAAMVAGLLAGCSLGPFDTDHLATVPPLESAFQAALSREYVALGDLERHEYDWPDTARFYRRATTAANGERVGLGLAIVKSHVDTLDGELLFDSVVDHGTTVAVLLPESRLSGPG